MTTRKKLYNYIDENIKNNKDNILKNADFFLLNHLKYIIESYNINHDCNIYVNINNLKKDDIIEVIKGV